MIPITFLRSSSYGSHDICSQKYFIEYILGWKSPGGKAANLGTVSHKVLELLAKAKKEHQNGKPAFYDEESNISVTLDSNIEQLTEESYNYYSKRMTHIDWVPADLKFCHKTIAKALEFNSGQFDPRKQYIIDAEPHFDFDMQYDWAQYEYVIKDETIKGQLALKGTIDLIVKIDDDVYEIVDYKTGKYRRNWATGKTKEHADFREDFQLRLYHYAAHVLYPNIDHIIVTIYYINSGGPFTIQLDRSDIPETVEMIKEKFEHIKNTETPKILYEESPKDSWKCKKLCDARKEIFKDVNGNPIIENRYGEITRRGEKMCLCESVKFVTEKRGLQTVIDNMSKEGHDVNYYEEPGSV